MVIKKYMSNIIRNKVIYSISCSEWHYSKLIYIYLLVTFFTAERIQKSLKSIVVQYRIHEKN